MTRRMIWLLVGWGSIALGAAFLDSAAVVPPGIWWFHPASGGPGTRVKIVGHGFNEASLVTIGGTRAAFAPAGPLAIQVTVPRGAASGPITVTTAQGTVSSSAAFGVAP